MKCLCLFPLLLALTVNVSANSEENNPLLHQLRGKNRKKFDRPYKFIFELRKENTFIRHCGGAQLNLNWFITAAECLDRSASINDPLRMLTLNSEDEIKREAMIWLERKIHPEYNEETKANNIGLLKACPVVTSSKALMRPSGWPKLPSTTDKLNTPPKEPVVVFGWMNWPMAESLTMTNLETTLINPWWCRLTHPLRFKGGQHLCAFGELGNGLSQGDVGAPLVITKSDKTTELIGIATDVRPFTNVLPMPMVFTSIAPYVEWIKKEANITIY